MALRSDASADSAQRPAFHQKARSNVRQRDRAQRTGGLRLVNELAFSMVMHGGESTIAACFNQLADRSVPSSITVCGLEHISNS
jgi:hypothetical protein